jgi:hypothetical protein
VAKSRKKRRRRAPGERPPKLPKKAPVAGEAPSGHARPALHGGDQRPPAPWGSFPLQELAVLVALVMLGIGLFSGNPVAIAVGVVLGCLAGLELSLREHFAGYRSHTTLIAGSGFVLTVAVLFYAAHLVLIVCLGVGAAIFIGCFLALRRAFQRASGGLSYRVGGLRG